MSELEFLTLQQNAMQLQCVVFDKITNAEVLKEAIGTPVDCGYVAIDLHFVLNSMHVRNGLLKALLSQQQQCLRTGSLHGDLIYHLSASRNMADVNAKFEFKKDTTSAVFINFSSTSKSFERAISDVVGEKHDISYLDSETFLSAERKLRMQKYFKVSAAELAANTLESSVINSIAVKDL